MKNQIINILEKDGFVKIFSSFLAIIIGLLLGSGRENKWSFFYD